MGGCGFWRVRVRVHVKIPPGYPCRSLGGGDNGGSGGGGEEDGSDDGSEIDTSSEGGSSPAVIDGTGDEASVIIPDGTIFAGRTAGGATRVQIYGNRLVQVDSYLPNLTLSCRAVNTEADTRT